MPLYQQVRQEYVPSDVDEAEFNVNVTAPEGTSVAAMNEVMQLVENDFAIHSGCPAGFVFPGRQFSGGCQ